MPTTSTDAGRRPIRIGHPEAMEIAGYRVLRTLARGPTAEFLLGFGSESVPFLVVIRRPIEPDDPHTERVLAAYSGSDHPHIARLLDVGVDERGAACAVLERLADDLPALLLARDGLTAGEAVTILAPIAMALDALHDAGIAHGSLGIGSIRFRDDGAPVLVGFGGAAFFAPASPEVMRERVPEVVSDREAMRMLSLAVLARVDDGATSESAERIRVAPHSRVSFELIEALRSLGPAAPIATTDPARITPVRAIAISDVVESDARTGWPPGVETRSDRLVRLVATVRRLVAPMMRAGPTAAFRGALGERWRSLSARSRRLAVAGAVSVALIAFALTAIPPPHRVAAGSHAPSGVSGTDPVASAAQDPALTGEDPVAAARALLLDRDRCIRRAARSCLDGVDQPDSPAAVSDQSLIATIVGGSEPPASPEIDSMRLTQRWGDTALISLGPNADPASLLLMRGEAGWRIRSYQPRP